MKKATRRRFCAALLTMVMVMSVFAPISVAAAPVTPVVLQEMQICCVPFGMPQTRSMLSAPAMLSVSPALSGSLTSGDDIFAEVNINQPLEMTLEEIQALHAEAQATADAALVISDGEVMPFAAMTTTTMPGYSYWGYCQWGFCPVVTHAIPTEVGVYFQWYSCDVPQFGYRIFRSLTPSWDGAVSITDFPIESNGIRWSSQSFFDANIFNLAGLARGEYNRIYYRVEAVLEEARLEFDAGGNPSLIPELLTWSNGWIAVYVYIPEEIDRIRGVITLEIGNPIMEVNRANYGLEFLSIDPGVGTAPSIVDGRTVVPIRAIVETMTGRNQSHPNPSVLWDADDRRMDLNAYGLDGTMNNVSMWLERTDATMNGEFRAMDVAPFINQYNRSLIPVRYASEFLGLDIAWIGSVQKVFIVYLLQDEHGPFDYS